MLKGYKVTLKQMAGSGESSPMSARAATAMGRLPASGLAIFDVEGRCRDDEFNADTNPKGMINMGTSENYLMQNEIMAKLSEPGFFQYDKTMFVYNNSFGHPTLRKAIAEFLTERGDAPQPLDPDKVIIMNGTSPCIDALAFCIGDPQDAFLCPTPFYGFIVRDVAFRSELSLFHVDLSSKPGPGEEEPFQLTVDKLEEGLQQAKQQGVNIRGLFLINPHNPLGDIYTETQLRDMLLFCKRHQIHVVLDEIYLTSIFEEGAQHSSILRYKTEDIPDPERTHFIWGFSKDFGLSGFRAGMLYTWNSGIEEVCKQLADIQQIPAPTQHSLARLLQDKDFLDNTYFPTYHQRLRESHKIVTDKLKELGIPYVHRGAGLYLYADFSKHLSSNTSEAEDDFFDAFVKNKLYFRSSAAFYGKEHGWFRIVFSREKEICKIAMERLDQVCQEIQQRKEEMG